MGIMNYTLSRPDKSLRMIAIKQMSGMPLTQREVSRLANRQGVEDLYAARGFGVGGNMNDAYKRAGAPIMMKDRLAAYGATTGRLEGEYGEENLERARKLKARLLGQSVEMGDAHIAGLNEQNNFNAWNHALMARQREENDRAQQSVLRAFADQHAYDATPESIRDQNINPDRFSAAMDDAARVGDFPSYSALHNYIASRDAAAQKSALAKSKADIAAARAAMNVKFMQARIDNLNKKTEAMGKTQDPRAVNIPGVGNVVVYGKSILQPKAQKPAERKKTDVFGAYKIPSSPLEDPRTGEAVYPTDRFGNPNPAYMELVKYLRSLQAGGTGQPQGTAAPSAPKAGNNVNAIVNDFFGGR